MKIEVEAMLLSLFIRFCYIYTHLTKISIQNFWFYENIFGDIFFDQHFSSVESGHINSTTLRNRERKNEKIIFNYF